MGLPPKKIGMCYMQGDPHILTFDGAHITTTQNGNRWLVHSPDGVQIQALWRDSGRTRAVAFGGKWMKGHKLIVETYKDRALLDGKEILTQDGQEQNVDGVLEVKRYGKGGMKLSEEQLKELDGAKT